MQSSPIRLPDINPGRKLVAKVVGEPKTGGRGEERAWHLPEALPSRKTPAVVGKAPQRERYEEDSDQAMAQYRPRPENGRPVAAAAKTDGTDQSQALTHTAMRQRLLDERMALQETTMMRLLERAYCIQQELERNNKDLRDGLEQGRQERQLLAAHVRTTSEMFKHIMGQATDFRKQLSALTTHMDNHKEAIRQLDANIHTLMTDSQRRTMALESNLSMLGKSVAVSGDDILRITSSIKREREVVNVAIASMEEKIAALKQDMFGVAEDARDTQLRQQREIERTVAMSKAQQKSDVEQLLLTLMEAQNRNLQERESLRMQMQAQIETIDSKSLAWVKETDARVTDGFDKVREQIHSESKLARDCRSTLEEQIGLHRRWAETALADYEKSCASTLHTAQRNIEAMHNVMKTKEAVLREEMRREWEDLAKSLLLM